jgi:16S rRNA (guanine(966)-N(2))-methyltransferase RsmD
VSHSLRVIAGRLGGRRLSAPRGQVTRPTGARVREALFAILGPLDGVRVLDLYAGTGALSIEALSRGAERAVLVEHDRNALACLRENVETLALAPRAVVVPLRLPRALAAALAHGPFELVLCDPPWADLASASALFSRLPREGGLAPGARLVLEHAEKDDPPALPGLAVVDRRTWGDTAVTMFRADPAREAEP